MFSGFMSIWSAGESGVLDAVLKTKRFLETTKELDIKCAFLDDLPVILLMAGPRSSSY
jgi:hypothetical protein